MAQVFISYSRKDLPFVEQFAADLENAGFDVWYDVSDLRGGARWRFEIEKALRNSQYAIFVLSPDSIASEWVEREFLFASNLKRGLIPLMYRACELPLSYLNLNFIDVQGENYNRNFNEILRSLGSQPGAEAFQPEPTQAPIQPPSRKLLSFNPVVFVVGLAVLGLLLGSTLLVKWYSSVSAQKITATFPSSPVPATQTITSTPTATTAPPSPTSTPVSILLGTFWISYNSDQSGNRDIILLNPDTGESRKIIADPSHDKVGTWSPNGKFLAFESNRNSTNYYQIYLFDNDQERIIRLTELAECSNWAPAWSPDGTKLVFYSNCENERRDIFVMNRDGSGRKKLTSGGAENRFPSWSPDGNSITFTSTRDGRDKIMLMNVDGSNQRIIVDGCSSTFSPDGDWLWFSTRCADSDIKRIKLDGTNVATIGSVFGSNPVVSPDGQRVVFESSSDIWMMGIDGSNPTQLTSGSAVDGAPSWQP